MVILTHLSVGIPPPNPFNCSDPSITQLDDETNEYNFHCEVDYDDCVESDDEIHNQLLDLYGC